jgi:hypothetical protein
MALPKQMKFHWMRRRDPKPAAAANDDKSAYASAAFTTGYSASRKQLIAPRPQMDFKVPETLARTDPA